MNTASLPRDIFSGCWNTGHCQGIAVDTKREYIYYSFTTALVKTDLGGNLIGSVTGLLGHLGCIDFNDGDGRVYGSLEYKNDAIGRGILNMLGSKAEIRDAFYIAIFDVDKIDRPGMDACADGVMTTVYLKEVVDDFTAETVNGGRALRHRLGCSGIDGTTFGPMPGSGAKEKEYLFVAYGVYGDTDRTDNDHQVILCYDTADWARYERPLRQDDMHTDGPAAPLKKLFVYTGNTTYGVQNLEYDAYTDSFLMAVYTGKKPQFPNLPLYIADDSKAPEEGLLRGVEPETRGELLSLRPGGEAHAASGVNGWRFPLGSTGLCALGDGYYYLSHDGKCDDGYYTHVKLYRWDENSPFAPVEA